jgi:hypothetical protein
MAWGYLGTADRMAKLGALMKQAQAATQSSLEAQRVGLFEKGVWEYMLAGRATYEKHLAQKALAAQRVQVPALTDASPGGDPAKVDWSQAAVMTGWRTLMGDTTPRQLEGRVTHDGSYLYLQLEERLNPKTLVITDDDVWGEDEWEIFVARDPKLPYRQMGVNAKGTHIDLAWGEADSKWDSGAVVISDRSVPDRWTTRIAFPLAKLLPGGATVPSSIRLNVIRSTKMSEALAWIPTFGGYHAPEMLGEVVLQR